MSRGRMIAVASVLIALAGLLLWQSYRERRVAGCVALGGTWHGPTSVCEPSRGPILQREDLKRS